MTKTIIVDEKILNDEDYIQTLCNKIEESEINFKIFLMSTGGNPFLGSVIIDCLNHSDNINRIELIALSYVESTAFDIFYKFKGSKSIVFGTSGMYHHIQFSGLKITGDSVNTSNTDFKCTIQKAKTLAYKTIEISKQFCNEKEIKIIKQGKECHFTFERMLEIFPNIKIIQ